MGKAAAWIPFHTPKDYASQRGGHYLDAIGRLANGATLAFNGRFV